MKFIYLNIRLLMLFSLLLIHNNSFGQSASNYTPVRSTGITFSTILGTGTAIAGWRNASDDDSRSDAITIGFDFWYIGTKYTTLSVSTNGFLDFSSATDDGSLSGAFGYDQTDFYGTSSTVLALAPLYDDLEVPTRTSNGSVAYSLTGSAPNRVFTVEWLAGLQGSCADGTCNTYNFQVKINESTGVIEYWYGSMTGDLDYVCGLNGATVSATPTAAQYLDQTTANTATFGQGQTTLATVPATNTKIVFSPPTTTVPTSLTFSNVLGTGMTLNWTNAGSNRVVSAIYKSTDDVTYTYDGTASSAATTYTASGLTTNTTYYWKVYSVSEGYVSTALSNSQATSVGTTVTWDGGAGTLVWTTASNWSGDVAPIATDLVVFNTAGTFTITSVPTLSLGSLTISNGTVTLSGSTTTLTLGYGSGTDLTIASTKGLTLSGVSITLASNATADISGTFTVTTGTFNTDGTSVVSTVATTGSISCAGTVTCTSTAKLIFEGSSSYTHNKNGGTIPTADWNGATNTATSTCTVSGMTSTKPGGLVTTSNTFYHFTWNCSGQTAHLISSGVGSIAASGENFTCLGNFTLSNSNGYTIAFSDVSAGSLSTFTCGGNMETSSASGIFRMNYWSTPVTANITGDLNVSNMTFYGHDYTSGATTAINVTGNLNLSSGTFYTAGSTYSGTTLTVSGNLNITGGTFVGAQTTGTCTINVTGNLNFSGGLFYGSNSTAAATINIDGSLNLTGGTFRADNSASPVYTILGNLSISSNGYLRTVVSTGDPTFNITGNFTTSGSAIFYGSVASGGNPIFNIQGSVDLSTGTIEACNGYTSNAFTCTFNLTGTASNNLTLKTGLTYNTSAAWKWDIASGRTITLLSNVELGGTASSCSFTNNGTLIMGTYTFPALTTAAASFVNASGATLKTATLTGITALGTATGAILVTGTRTYNAAGIYVFNGTAAQITGTFATTVGSLEFNNTAGVTLSQGITVANGGTHTLTAGYHDLATYTLQVGTSSTSTVTQTAGGLYSATNNGSFKRYIPAGAVASTGGANYGLFPFAKAADKVAKYELNSTVSPTGAGFITGTPAFSGSLVDVSYADDHATVDYIVTLRSVVLVSTATGGTYTLKLTAATLSAGTASDLTLVTYTASTIGYLGAYVANSGTAPAPVLSRTGITDANISTAQTFVIGTYNQVATPLPIQLISFKGKKVGIDNELEWTTASELNNDFFTVERTYDGTIFETVGTQNGAGNSSDLLDYFLLDYNVRPVINYYRLKQTDFDGQSTFSDMISIDNTIIETSKVIVQKTNILGQEVNEHYRGLVVILYSDGTSIKVIQ